MYQALLSWKSDKWPRGDTNAAPASDPTPTNQPAAVAPRPPRIPTLPVRAVVRPNRRPIAAVASVPEPLLTITAADPYTSPAYRQRTGLPCLELSFNQVAAGELPPPPQPHSNNRCDDSTRNTDDDVDEKDQAQGGKADGDGDGEGQVELYDIVIVSFALHLVESPSELWALLTELAKRAKWLCVIAPHKKPEVGSTLSRRY